MALKALKYVSFPKQSAYSFFASIENSLNTKCFHTGAALQSTISKQAQFQKLVEEWDTTIKKTKTSKAMKAYLDRAQAHDEFLKKEEISYQIGKRHLANMMGEDPNTFSQEDIDRSIEYLFPSGIFDKAARPSMKPPKEVFPARKAAEFDEAGRPHHFLFYTGRPNYYKVLFDVSTHIKELNNYEDAMIRKNVAIDPESKLSQTGYSWLTKDELEHKLLENIVDIEYNNFILTFERLMAVPYSNRIRDFVDQFRKPLSGQKKTLDFVKPIIDENGRSYVTTYECLRKNARGHVTVRSPGTGIVTINGKDISYFHDDQSREQVLFPLLFTGTMHSVDVEAHVENGGPSGQAGCVRWGIACSLRSFVSPEMLESMRIAGLLTRDYRRRERKKPGQPGARAKHTWKKR